MPLTQVTALLILLLTSALSEQVIAANINQQVKAYANEHPIEFKSNDGQSTDAFQGYILVPENRNNPDSRKIKVAYVRFPSTGNVVSPPIVYLSGGPGGSGIAAAKWKRYPLFMALREFGDVIALEQRGTGISDKAQECTSSQRIGHLEVVSDALIRKRYRAATLECMDFWREQGVDVLGYNTVQNAWDINDLRVHLGAEKVVLWGISYGSHLALAALNLYAENIEKVIIASAEGLDQTVKLPASTDKYFSRIQEVINQQEGLKKQYPDIINLIKRVHAKLEASPINVSIPQQEGEPLKLLFQRYHMQMLASMTIADPGEYLALLLQLYKSIDNGTTDLLVGVLQRGVFNDEIISFRLMNLAMDIASGISDTRLAKVQSQSTSSLLGQMLNFPMPQLNMIVPELDLGKQFRKAKTSKVPTLLFTGTLDGRTYIEEQKNAVKHLSVLTHIMVENAGHNLFTSSPMVLEAMQSFMRKEPIKESPIVLELPKLE